MAYPKGKPRKVLNSNGTKVCTGCGKELPLEMFYKQPRGAGGRRSRCNECTCLKVREWQKANRCYRSDYRADQTRRPYGQQLVIAERGPNHHWTVQDHDWLIQNYGPAVSIGDCAAHFATSYLSAAWQVGILGLRRDGKDWRVEPEYDVANRYTGLAA